MRIVITGAAGHIGRKLVDYLLAQGDRFEVVGLDLHAAPPYTTESSDLSTWNEAWVARFEGADVVVHLAADRYPTATWETILPLNLDLMLNVYEAARLHKVGRIVFASSNWVLGGYRFEDNVTLTPETHPLPVNPYGASKLFAERYGKQLSEREGISVINLRIGYNQWLRNNEPSPAMELGAWGQMLWLSDRDYCDAMERAITAPNIPYATLNVTSRTHPSRWDLSETERVLGYVPKDDYRVTMPIHRRATQVLARLRDKGGARLRRLVSENW
jgi:NAD+ dependent glucose-6-phosphate dehydrogenase